MADRLRFVYLLAMLMAAGLSLGAGCEDSRERPTGLNISVPPTQVSVQSPQANDVLFIDSTVVIVIDAEGLIQAAEFVLLSVSPVIDTVATGRQEYQPPVEFVDQEFSVVIPTLVSGSTLQIHGLAENLIGERTFSAPVTVTAVDCDIEPFRCQ
jgi:hypothetical protein